MVSTSSLSSVSRALTPSTPPIRASTLVPFLIGTAVGMAAGTVFGALVGRELGHAVTDLVVHADSRHPEAAEPRFEYLLQ